MRKKLYFSRFIKCFILINMIGSFPYLSAQESDDIKKSTPIKKQDANKITQPQKDVLLKEQNRILTKENSELETKNDVLQGKYDQLLKSHENMFILYGALAVVIGSLLTSFVSSISRKKKYDEWR